MTDIDTLVGEMHAEFDKLESDISTRLHGLLDQVLGHVPAIEAEAKTDAETIAHDAETAAAPVAAEAKTYAVHLAGEVATDAVAAVEAAS